jgi:hypothetical protein
MEVYQRSLANGVAGYPQLFWAWVLDEHDALAQCGRMEEYVNL